MAAAPEGFQAITVLHTLPMMENAASVRSKNGFTVSMYFPDIRLAAIPVRAPATNTATVFPRSRSAARFTGARAAMSAGRLSPPARTAPKPPVCPPTWNHMPKNSPIPQEMASIRVLTCFFTFTSRGVTLYAGVWSTMRTVEMNTTGPMSTRNSPKYTDCAMENQSEAPPTASPVRPAAYTASPNTVPQPLPTSTLEAKLSFFFGRWFMP